MECPLCGWRFRFFLPGGRKSPAYRKNNIVVGGWRRNAICPHCDCSDRERHVYLYLKVKTSIFSENVKLLHVAPEKNLNRVFREHGNIDYLAADLESPLAPIKMDITRIELDDNVFDVIICNHVLEHIPDDRKAMSELYRVLKPAGWAILQTPVSMSLKETYEDPSIVSPEQRELLFGQFDHVRIYARDYEDRLKDAGFSVEHYSYPHEFGETTAQKYGLIKDEELYICRKPALPEEAS